MSNASHDVADSTAEALSVGRSRALGRKEYGRWLAPVDAELRPGLMSLSERS